MNDENEKQHINDLKNYFKHSEIYEYAQKILELGYSEKELIEEVWKMNINHIEKRETMSSHVNELKNYSEIDIDDINAICDVKDNEIKTNQGCSILENLMW